MSRARCSPWPARVKRTTASASISPFICAPPRAALLALPALRYYLLIAQERRLVELYSRDESGAWRHQLFEDQGEIQLDCPPLQPSLTLDDLYEDVVLA